jgi:hypothetical protein
MTATSGFLMDVQRALWTVASHVMQMESVRRFAEMAYRQGRKYATTATMPSEMAVVHHAVLRTGGIVFLRCAAGHSASTVFVVMAGRLGWKLRRIITVMMETNITPMVVRGSVPLSAGFHASAAAWTLGIPAALCVVMDSLPVPRSVTTAIRSAETGAARRARWKSAGNVSKCSMKTLAAVSRRA